MKWIGILIVLVSMVQCREKTKKSPYGCDLSIYVEPPSPPMTFSFIDNQKFYRKMGIDTTKDTLALGYCNRLIYYRQDTSKIFVDFVLATRLSKDRHSKPFISSGSVLLKSYSEGIKKFFIDWPDGSTDTLYADFIFDHTGDNACCCQYPLRSLQLNSKTYTDKSPSGNYGLYLFE